jgi:hypothetical protein
MKNTGTVYGIVVLIMLLCFSQSKAAPDRNLPGNSDSIQALAVPAPVPEITGIKSDTKYRDKNIVLYGDHITFTVKNLPVLLTKLDSLTDEGIKDSLFPILLYVNGMPANEIRANSINRTDGKISFELHRGSETLKRFRLNIFSAALPVSFSLGIKGYDPIQIAPKLGIIKLRFISYVSLLTMITMIIIMLFTFRWLVLKTNVIRVTSSNSKYSLGLAQLLFWVVLVAFAFVYIYVLTDGIHPITGSVLTLLTISFSTSGSSRVVDKVVDPKRMFESESKGFIEDIISDDISYSVHRVQMVIWTAILGLVFCYEVIIHLAMPQFDTNLLLLMGISSSGYIGLKAVEHTKKDIKKHGTLPSGENIEEDLSGIKKE